ncbi:c-type cytochrome [Sulfuriferula thiophila]|uniref:c-type cytochrome n=1 Tax=Sulfuriferula thiophila TaxID=1781211 RepID=UPI000F60A51E|nr:c-type cytochrome [Sulfuriferula thiophila]
MKLIINAAAIALVMVASQASAADNTGLSLAQKNACMTCHSVDKKIVGPAYKDVAAKYKGDKTAEAHLMDKVKKGGAGVWGQIPMPPNPQVKDEDLRVIVKWILALQN